MAQNGLAPLVQEDFSGGAFPGYSRDSIPRNAVEDGVNVYITDDGQFQGRGGASIKQNADLFTPAAAQFLWEGYLTPGRRTLVAGGVSAGTYGELQVLGSDDATPLSLGTTIGVGVAIKPASIGGFLIIPAVGAYAGSLKTGLGFGVGATISVTNGSTTVVGSGTSWLTDIDAGTILRRTGDTARYIVKSVTDNTHLELTQAYAGTTGAAVAATVSALSAITYPITNGVILGAAANKLIVASPLSNRAYMSNAGDPFTFATNEYHELPNGVQLHGIEGNRDAALLFTTAGVWSVGNIAFDLTDAAGNPQQRLEQMNRHLVLWGYAGIAAWESSLIVPATDGVYLVDSVSAPVPITGGFSKLYRSYVAAGYFPGYGTVVDEHFYLPITSYTNTGSSAYPTFVDLLVCRLRASRRGAAFGWTRFSGDGAKTIGVLSRTTSSSGITTAPTMIGGDLESGRVLALNYRDPATTTDPDGSAPGATIVTRELTGDVNTLVKKLRIRYELTDPSSVNPTLTAEWAQGDGSYTALATAAAENTDPTTNTWVVNKRNPHFRLKTVGATSNFTLHSMTMLIRPSGRQ